MSKQTNAKKTPATKKTATPKKPKLTAEDFVVVSVPISEKRATMLRERIHDLAKLQTFIAEGAKIADIRDALLVEADGRANTSVLNRLVGRYGSMMRDILARKVGLEGRKLRKAAVKKAQPADDDIV